MRSLFLIAITFLISTTALATCTLTVTSPVSGSSFTVGSTIAFSATVSSGCSTTITSVSFYKDGGAQLCGPTTTTTTTTDGSGNTVYSYSCSSTVNITGSPLYVMAQASTSAAGTSSSTYKWIDVVGNSSYASNPALDSNFGLTKNGITVTGWTEGDNQFCSTTGIPYNGATSVYPDGSCEWMNKANIQGTTIGGTCANSTCSVPPCMCSKGKCPDSSKCSGVQPPTTMTDATEYRTIDGLDDAMHTLSDFAKFSNSLLNIDEGSLLATFSNWYPQASLWIGQKCLTQCTATQINQNTCPSSATCNQGGNGRLLSLYNPDSSAPVDVFKTWNDLMTTWLNTKYATDSAWCVPLLESTVRNNLSSTPTTCSDGSACPASGRCAVDSMVCAPLEDAYITSNTATTSCSGTCSAGICSSAGADNSAACSFWGDMSHVIACEKYNAGSETPGTDNYHACLAALPQGKDLCPTTFPPACSFLTPPASCSGTCNAGICSSTGAACSHIAFIGDGLTDCETWYTTPASVSTTSPYAPNSTYPNAKYYYPNTPSFAQWVSNQIYSGPAYNYQQCSLLVQNNGNVVPASVTNTVCDPRILGRSLTGNPAPSNASASYTVFSSEAPKFALRAPFLTDIYNRGATMQAIFNDEDTVLQKFFATKNVAGATQDGPVAKLYTYALQASATSSSGTIAATVAAAAAASVTANFATLPNAVIYGWVDNPYPNGHKGYAHVVKVTAYSPGRAGSAALTAGNGMVWSMLPWIQSWSTFFTQYYTLQDRDGYVYVNVKRWDQDHEYNGPGQPAITFPNNHTLWQFLFHSPGPSTGTSTGYGTIDGCTNPQQSIGSVHPGYGLLQQTVNGFIYAMSNSGYASYSDTKTGPALENAFMLNDRGHGKTDPSVFLDTADYQTCLGNAVVAANYGVQSTACAQYIADPTASVPSGTTDRDYSLKFVDCNTVPYIHGVALDDLTGEQ